VVSGQPTDGAGTPLAGIGPVSSRRPPAVNAIHPAIHIEKSVAPARINPGDTVTYTYVVTNPAMTP